MVLESEERLAVYRLFPRPFPRPSAPFILGGASPAVKVNEGSTKEAE